MIIFRHLHDRHTVERFLDKLIGFLCTAAACGGMILFLATR